MTEQERVSLAFYEWETRLRGWDVYQDPVQLEPPFSYFTIEPIRHEGDDGKVSLFPRSKRGAALKDDRPQEGALVDDRPEGLVEISLGLHNRSQINASHWLQFLLVASQARNPVTIEVAATAEILRYAFVVEESDAFHIRGLVQAYLPDISVRTGPRGLSFHNNSTVGIIEFGLAHEVLSPILEFSSFSGEPHLGLLTVMDNLAEGESIVIQTTFSNLKNPWTDALWDATTNSDGSFIFGDSDELQDQARRKLAEHLVAARWRIALQSNDCDHTRTLADRILGASILFDSVGANHLVPLSNKGIEYEAHLSMVKACRSQRTGMILSLNELAMLAHIPAQGIGIGKLATHVNRSCSVPLKYRTGDYSLGVNIHDGESTQVRVRDVERLRHMHVLGATGTGKSSFILGMAMQDANAGNGFTLMDPHGDLVDALIAGLPQNRLDDVILFDPSDTEFPIGLNLLQAETESEKVLLTSDLISVFKRQSTSWGDRMSNILSMSIAAFMERGEPGTLIELRQFLLDRTYRKEVLKEVNDPLIQHFFEHDFKGDQHRATAPIIARLNSFLIPKTLRHAMAIGRGLDMKDVLSQKKILLAKLSQGLIGEENAHLLGTMILAKLYQASLARQSIDIDKRDPHYLYIDEFHSFRSASMPAILTGVRKYGLGLVLAHQSLEQLNHRDQELKQTLLANAFGRIAFRIGEEDARIFERGTTHFEAKDYLELGTGEAIIRLGSAKDDCNIVTPDPKNWSSNAVNRDAIVMNSRKRYATPRSEVSDLVERIYSPIKSRSEAAHLKKELEAADSPEKQVDSVKNEGLEDFEGSVARYKEGLSAKSEMREHRYLQESIRSMAAGYGWRTQVEAPVKGGRIDVLLMRDGEMVGIEISVSNKIEYELQNVVKCIDHGCNAVMLICENGAKRQQIRSSIELELNNESKDMVTVMDEGEFREWLLQRSPKPSDKEMRVAGYRVNVKYNEVDDADERNQAIREALLRAIRDPKKDH